MGDFAFGNSNLGAIAGLTEAAPTVPAEQPLAAEQPPASPVEKRPRKPRTPKPQRSEPAVIAEDTDDEPSATKPLFLSGIDQATQDQLRDLAYAYHRRYHRRLTLSELVCMATTLLPDDAEELEALRVRTNS